MALNAFPMLVNKGYINILLLISLTVGYTIDIYGRFWGGWHIAGVKWFFYILTGTAFVYTIIDEIRGYRSFMQMNFNIICKFTMATNFILIALILQGVLSSYPFLCLIIMYFSVLVITLSVVYNLKKYDYFND